MDDTEFII